MRSSRGPRLSASAWALAAAIAGSFASFRADAQEVPTPARGFALERLAPSAAGAGWVALDALDMQAGLGGAAGLVASYARRPLRIHSADGAERLSVVSDEAILDVGFAATYRFLRASVAFDVPLALKGTSGTVSGTSYAAPDVGLGTHPDALADVRVGFDARLLGEPESALRLGAGVRVFAPSGDRVDYVTDHTFRATFLALAAGDAGGFTYAAHAGVHVRPLDDSPVLGSPRGSELVFGVAGGLKVPLGASEIQLVVGPEVFGATALRGFFRAPTTALEGLVTGRVEGTGGGGPRLRFKLGAGGGLVPEFGAPDARVVVGIEASGTRAP